MKKILVPTDFSDCAGYALDAAVKIADKVGAELHLLHKIKLDDEYDEKDPKSRLDYPESFARLATMKKRFSEIRKQYENTRVRIKTFYDTGNLIKTISSYVDEEEVDLIVMGSSGADGWKEWILGSQTQKVVRYAHCPVLVVKHQWETINLSSVVFASDFTENAIKPFERLLDFVKPFKSHIHLLNITAYPKLEVSDADIERMKKFEKMCWMLPCTLHTYKDLDRELGVTHFAKETQANLVAISHYGKDALKRLFLGSLAEDLINHLTIPVITLNTKELKTWKEVKNDSGPAVSSKKEA
ncbi:MAG: universal stress protein [Bacteroidetes bacterium]|nr:universal stress protein [Bacteroidota bacterium]